jgi:putative acetyltransferase
MHLRFANNQDQKGIVDLIDGVLKEHNDSICLENSESDLKDIQEHFFESGGAFWVLVDSTDSLAKVVGTHAVLPILDNPTICTFKRLYLAKNLRGGEWGNRLMLQNIEWAKEQGMTRVEFWSDTRFARAHRFFEKFGFESSGEIRVMHDSHEPYKEVFFYLDLES